MCFVDGMPLPEYAFRDMVNCYNILTKGGILIVDDVLPESLLYSQRIRLDPIWSGDVYKSLFFWKQFFSHSILIIDCKPSCLALIKKTHEDTISMPVLTRDMMVDSVEWMKRLLSIRQHFQIISGNSFLETSRGL